MRLYIERGWLDQEEALAIGAEFPDWLSPSWPTFEDPLEEGKQEGRLDIAGPLTAALHDRLSSTPFCDWPARVLSTRSEERRVGTACVSSGISRWWPYH